VVPVRVTGPSGTAVVRLALDTGATRSLINSSLLVAVGYDPAATLERTEVTTGSGVEYAVLISISKIEGAIAKVMHACEDELVPYFVRFVATFRLAACGMKTENESPSSLPRDFQDSMLGEIYIPITVAAVPAALFALLGLITEGLDNPRVEPPTLVIVAMIVVQTLGIIAMAFVILMRLEFAFGKLLIYANGHPHAWRKATLTLSIFCLLMFDILTNVSAAFAGAEFLLVASVPVFLAYLVCNRVAFAGLCRP
jgi:hypothetical protein